MDKINITQNFDPQADFIYYEGDILHLLKKVPDSFIKLVITSPPYNIGKEYESKVKIKEYLNNQERVIKECVRVLDNNGSICWQVGNFVDNGEIIPLDIVLYPIFSS